MRDENDHGATWAATVVGLDKSEAMLREARARTEADHVRYVHGDFGYFTLGETFDAVICAGDSLNYLEETWALAGVFQCVRQHLRHGGLFIFDVVGELHVRSMATIKAVTRVGDEKFEIYYFYHPVRRVSESRVVMDGEVERHLRIPLDPIDVEWAAAATGLVVADQFAEGRHFYVLRRT